MNTFSKLNIPKMLIMIEVNSLVFKFKNFGRISKKNLNPLSLICCIQAEVEEE